MTETTDPPQEPTPQDLSGRQLGKFRLLRQLGHGAMAEVYLAEQADLKRQVAVKVLKAELARDQTYVKRFQREAQAAANLAHANIVQIYEVGSEGAIHYIAQEYVQGLNLRQWLTRHGTADLPLAVSLIRQVAAALSKAADLGIVHRDIKPENIILTREGEVKVADFGLARLPPRLGEIVELTQVGMTMGSPLYMSPEQVEGKPLDHRSDLYSLGVTCYQILAGNPPFMGETALSVAVQHLKKQPEPLENHRSDLPPALCRLVHRMLAKDPASRYQSARDVLRDLHQIQVEHLGNQWPEDLPLWDSDGHEMAEAAPRIQATQRLAALMTSSSQAQLVRPRWQRWLAGAVIFLFFGALAGYLATDEPPLLSGSAGQLVDRRDSVFRQWIYASQVGTEEAWQAVIAYYPDRPFWVYRAKQQLARIYLREGRLDHAMTIFKELAALEETETELRAYGLAGQCAVLAMEHRYHEMTLPLDELWPIRAQLRDPQMRLMVNYALKSYRSKVGSEGRAEKWQEWAKKVFPEAG